MRKVYYIYNPKTRTYDRIYPTVRQRALRFAYVHSEKDILKLVTTLMTNTKGEGPGGDPFWEKSERLLLTALIAYLHNRQRKGRRKQ